MSLGKIYGSIGAVATPDQFEAIKEFLTSLGIEHYVVRSVALGETPTYKAFGKGSGVASELQKRGHQLPE